MQLSKFNVYVPLVEGRRTAVYNTWSGRYCVLPSSVAEILQRQQQSTSGMVNCTRLMAAHRELLSCGIVLPDDRDEQAAFDYRHHRAKHSEEMLKVLAVLTLDCDFHCPYCYQGPRKSAETTMRPETAEAIVEFVARELKRKKRKALVVGLYGGEPLRAVEAGNLLVEGIARLVSRRKLHVEYSLTTNGYHLADLFEQPMVQRSSYVHLTLEGHRDWHNSIRRVPGGGSSYDRILAGIRRLAAAGKQINVRIHSNRLTTRRLVRILDDLLAAGLNPGAGVMLYLMPVTKPCLGREKGCHSEDLQEAQERLRKTAALLKTLPDHPLTPLIVRQYHAPLAPLPVRATVCEYESASTFTVNWDGTVMICPTLGDRRRSLGQVTAKGLRVNGRNQKLAAEARHENNACRVCPYLPVCGGPCLLFPKPQRMAECRESPAEYHALITRYVHAAEANGVSKR